MDVIETFNTVQYILDKILTLEKNKQFKIIVGCNELTQQNLFWINSVMFEHKIMIDEVVTVGKHKYQLELHKY